VDELVDSFGGRDVTLQWSILAEGLNRSSHAKGGKHSAGMLVGGAGAGSHTIHHNLFAHNGVRNPEVGASEGYIDLVNNVIYNPRSRIIEFTSGGQTVRGNVVGNYLKRGNNSTKRSLFLGTRSAPGSPAEFVLFASGNYEAGPMNEASPTDPLHGRLDGSTSAERHPTPWVRTTAALRAYQEVLANAGATAPLRDSVDARIIADVQAGAGTIIDSPAEVGGWPELIRGAPPPDSDRDGMPDEWEIQRGLNARNAADRNRDKDGNGYTDLEDYLNELAGDLDK
jgi:hypothetical protein